MTKLLYYSLFYTILQQSQTLNNWCQERPPYVLVNSFRKVLSMSPVGHNSDIQRRMDAVEGRRA